MSKELVVSDASPIFSLAVIGQLDLLTHLFEEVYIPKAVWEEITQDDTTAYYQSIVDFFGDRVKAISGFNELTFVMDYGESESVMLYKELGADYLLIDDMKARKLAEHLGINCIGTLGLLLQAKEKGLIGSLKLMFETFLANKRYYSIPLLNGILEKYGEEHIKK